ncbi:MAG: H-X9-DG-CTERM domain-containing protein, partial [Pirellulaceae bacterium]
PGGVMVAFADGSTSFFNERIAYYVYAHLMTPNGRKSDHYFCKYVLQQSDYE